MKIIHFIIALLFVSLSSFSQTKDTSFKHIVIYEIAPKAFTSPNGPESGTFNSTAKKIPYLKKLGINTIWLTGHNWADNSHFYGIWTQYAVIRPDSIEASLGTSNDLKSLVQTAHHYGIKICLDAITHGVMSNSPLIKAHPTWFKGGSWGMTDYDWNGNHKDLDDWWVKTWTDYALKYDVDGFRLDLGLYRPDLWMRIKQICAEKGKPIFVLDEGDEPFTAGAIDFYQHHARFGLKDPILDTTCLFMTNVAKYFITDANHQSFYYSIELSCHDEGWEGFPAGVNPYIAKGSRYLMGYSCLLTPAIPLFMSGEEFNADYKPLPRLSPHVFVSKTLPGDSSKWLYGSWIQWNELQLPDKKAMWNDVQRMLAIRKSESDIIHAFRPSDIDKNILPVGGHYDKKLPVPYLMWKKNKAILVAANPDENKDIELILNVPLNEAGMNAGSYKVTDLWNETKPVIMSESELKTFKIHIKSDKHPRGGVAVYKITERH